MVASEIRSNARKALTGKWGNAALVTLIYTVLCSVLTLTFHSIIGSIIVLVITLPLSYGIIVTFMNLKKGQNINYTQFFTDGFNSFGKVWLVELRMLLKLLVPFILIMVSFVIFSVGLGSTIHGSIIMSSTETSSISSFGAFLVLLGFILLIASIIWLTVKYYLYVLSFYILKDNPNMTAKEVVEESERLMKGNRLSYFWLQLTFIGWAILAIITLGIGNFWLRPYIWVSNIEFYEQLADKTIDKKEEDTTDGEAMQEM